MNFALSLVAGLSLVASGVAAAPRADDDPARLRELLRDRNHPRLQSQAALLLVMNPSTEAAEIVRQGLRQVESPEIFLALATALRLHRDARFNDELFVALTNGSAERRHEAVSTLAHLLDAGGVRRMGELASDLRMNMDVRQAAVWALGRSGRKDAAAALIDQLGHGPDLLRQAAVDALTALTGQAFGGDTLRWQAWWEGRKNLSEATWLEERYLYQSSKARRLEGELDRARAEVVRLHQQLYGRVTAADRLGHVQATMSHEDPAVRALVVGWCLELLPGADAVGHRALAEILLGLSRDGVLEVQRPAVLALGRLNDPRACDRLRGMLRDSQPLVRAASARALAQQASLPRPDKSELTRSIQRQVVPALQKALEDPALEVVIEAAEDLGSLGLPEAVPVLSGLLKHPSEPVRQTAAQALERVADATVLHELLAALDESAVAVRFSLVGAVGHAAGDGRSLSPEARAKLLARLEDLLTRDTDPGVRSRAATVLGDCAPPSLLSGLWKRVQAAEDSRVQEKAWAAFISIMVRAGNIELLSTWDHALAEARQEAREVQLLTAAVEAWKKNPESRTLIAPATELLVQAHLQQSRWAAALPLLRELLVQPGPDADVARRLRWLLTAGEQALAEGNRVEAGRVVQDAQAFLPRHPALGAEFERLQKRIK